MAEKLDVTLVIPAYNEARTIKRVVDSVITSGLFQRIIVVNDGSDDRTSEIAQEAGAYVIDLYPNKGKGEAMRRSLECVETKYVMFLDADLLDVKTEHFKMLINKMLDGCDMVVGVLSDFSQKIVFRWSGQRIISTDNARIFFDVHKSITNFAVDGMMNKWAEDEGLKIRYVDLEGIHHVRKIEKRGLLRGIVGYIRMWWQIATKGK